MQDKFLVTGAGTTSPNWWLVAILVLVACFVVLAFVVDMIRRRRLLSQRVAELVMLEVKLPKESQKKEDEPNKQLADYLQVADQMFSTLGHYFDSRLSAWWYGQPVFSFEVVTRDKEIIFFVGTPKQFQESVEKQIAGYYPNAQIEPSHDFRIFDKEKEAAVGVLDLNKLFVYPLKTYRDLSADPMNNLTNSLSKLGDQVKANIQILIRPHHGGWRVAVNQAMEQLRSGRNVSMARHPVTRFAQASISDLLYNKNRDIKDMKPDLMREARMKLIQQKGEKTGFDCQIRIVVVAPTHAEAKEDVRNIFAAFAQFGSPDHNGFKLTYPESTKRYLPYVILRHFTRRHILLLNTEELATIFHFPNYLIETPGIRWFMAKRAPAPASLPTEGLLLGRNIYRGVEMPVRIKNDDRRRHLYSIGMTGTGKSTLFESMILQDIRVGNGVVVMDPHGELVNAIIGKIPKERAEDVIIFDPADRDRPLGLNLFEWKTPEQKDFLVQEAIQIFYKLFDPTGQGFIGPQFEHWMRNAALTLMESRDGGTLIEIPRLFVDDSYRQKKVAEVTDPVVKSFWEKQMAQTAEFHKSEMFNYFISKFGRFMTNDLMRNIMGQAKNSFDLREAMDSKKILLINLSKGTIGEINSNLLGMIFIARLFTSALSRQNISESERIDTYVYVDEFQNFATDTFGSILSEARKYRLNLNITNQYIAQIPEPIRDAIIGNVGTIASFRIGVPDAEFMAHEFAPVFNETDLNNIEAYNAYIKLLVNNAPTKPFSMKTIKDETPDNEKLSAAIKQLSRLKYGRDRSIVEAEVSERTRSNEILEPLLDKSRESVV